MQLLSQTAFEFISPVLLGVATHSLVCQLFGREVGPYLSRRHDTSFHTEDGQFKWPTFRWLGVDFISYLIVWNCQFCTARILSIHITQGEWLYQDYPHICYTLRQIYPSYILSSYHGPHNFSPIHLWLYQSLFRCQLCCAAFLGRS